MIITALKKKSSDVLVLFDDGTFLNLDYRLVIDFRLRKADLIDDEKLELLKENHSFLKIRDSAFRFLARRLHSTSELRTKLIKKKYPTYIIDKVLLELKEKQFVNDELFTKDFIAERIKNKKISANRLQVELYKRGIDKKISQEYLSEIDSETLWNNALFLAKKKFGLIKNKETDSRKISAKLFSFLMSKGYETDLIRRIMKEIKIEIED